MSVSLCNVLVLAGWLMAHTDGILHANFISLCGAPAWTINMPTHLLYLTRCSRSDVADNGTEQNLAMANL